MATPYTSTPLPVPNRLSLRDRVRGLPEIRPATRILQPKGEAILEWVGVNDLQVDDYQRKIRSTQVRDIVRNFNSDTYGILTVALRENGDLYVVDGQHRVVAMQLMQHEGENQEVRCVIISGWTPVDEAKFFAESQRNRSTITPGQAHNAEVYAGDEIAVAVNRAVEDAGYKIATHTAGKATGRINAVGALYRIAVTYDVPTLATALHVCAAAWGTERGPMEPTLNGVSLFLQMFPGVDRQRLIQRLGVRSEEVLIDKGRAISTSMGYKLQEAIAQELFGWYNIKMSTHRLADFPRRLDAVNARAKRGGVAARKPGAQR